MTISTYEKLKTAFIDWHKRHGYDTEYLFDANSLIRELLVNGEDFEDEDGSGTVYRFELCDVNQKFAGWGTIYEYEVLNPESEEYETIGWSWDF